MRLPVRRSSATSPAQYLASPPADGLDSWTTAGWRRTAPGEPGAVSRWTGTEVSEWSYGVELQRVQVCRYRARCCHRLARPACLAATGRANGNLESPPLSLAFT